MFLINKPVNNLKCAVIITCHNYGRYLLEAINSVNNQTIPPEELIIIDDSSTDNTKNIAKKHEVDYIRVNCRNRLEARFKGVENTKSDVLCFLDADDKLSPEYIEKGMACFGLNNKIGIVYSDMQRFGNDNSKWAAPQFSKEKLHRQNFMHAGSLVLREALVSSMAFKLAFKFHSDSDLWSAFEDWYVWKQIIEQGWSAYKQPTLYEYRIHDNNLTKQTAKTTYYQKAALSLETITLFIPLSGRHKMWPKFSKFLDKQTWPKEQIKLILMDSSNDCGFSKKIRKWAVNSKYANITITQFDAGEPKGSADEDRHNIKVYRRVQRAVMRIYNSMKSQITTPYVWILEDDVIPPLDCAELLLKSFDPTVVSASGAVPGRIQNHFLNLGMDGNPFVDVGKGKVQTNGNGFGCVMLRRETLSNNLFFANPSFCHGDFDMSFYKELEGTSVLNWDVMCQHGLGK